VKPLTARNAVKAVRGSPPPKTPDHALSRVALAASARAPLPCSRFGAPGGLYMARMVPKPAKKTRKGKTRGAWKGPSFVKTRRQAKVRRVDHTEAHAIIRRKGREAISDDRIVELYWIPPELVALMERDKLKALVTGARLRPVWTVKGGRQIERGDGVVRRRGR